MQKKKKQTSYIAVPIRDYLARYCNPQRAIRDLVTGEIKGVKPQAFELRRDIKEKYLSTYWLEFPPDDPPANTNIQYKNVLAALRKKHPNVKQAGAFVRLNVGQVMQVGSTRQHSLRILCLPKDNDPGYTGVYGMPLDNSDNILLAQLANECCLEVREVMSI